MFIRIQNKRIQCLKTTYSTEKKRCIQRVIFSMKCDDMISLQLEKIEQLSSDEKGALFDFITAHKAHQDSVLDSKLAADPVPTVDRLIRALRSNAVDADVYKKLLPSVKRLLAHVKECSKEFAVADEFDKKMLGGEDAK